ncbi:MAG: iron ABC transporter substrate-binding protein [Desulfobacteraceae bacterium]|nr:MAG: iron ABC transporter substrate-binding protein [Desulfobacteraceae bacterium]
MTSERYGLHAVMFLLASLLLSSCNLFQSGTGTRTFTDQLGRTVKIPEKIHRICALHHFGGKIVYALKKQSLLVDTSIYGKEALALKAIDPAFAAKPSLLQGNSYNVESMINLAPQVAFVYASSNRSEMEVFKNAGIPAIAVKGETFEESFEAIRLISSVLECEGDGEHYIKQCRDLIRMVQTRLETTSGPPVKVLFSGPKSIYSAATGSMLQTQILELSGAVNVANELDGFWADISPEQLALWNPDVIFLGSTLDAYGRDSIFKNPHFQTIKAIQDKKVYTFPSNVGWWDYPAPHCVLGVVWSAKILYPELFGDVDMKEIADQFYEEFTGHTFSALGGRLVQ